MESWLLRRASTAPGVEVDLTVVGGRVVDPTNKVDRVVDLGGRPCIPGLVDHHLHLMAQAAAWDSVDCAPRALAEGGGLERVLRGARARHPDGWLRGVGYDLTRSGSLDRHRLDAAEVGPVRIQDRTGRYWVLDSRGLDALLPAAPAEWPAGVQLDGAGHPTGVLVRLDGWLRSRLPVGRPDLSAVGQFLARRGVVAVTDATATNGLDELEIFGGAGLPQKITAMTAEPSTNGTSGVRTGPVKIVLDEGRLPSSDQLEARIDASHASGRSVALHCLDSASTVLALSCGAGPGDRIEHASLVDDGVVPLLARSGVTVVLQPGLVYARGDRYLEETEPSQIPDLYRVRSYLDAGVSVLLSSDAPFGPLDPWVTIEAAVHRRTMSGRELGSREAIDPADALRLLSVAAGANRD